MKTPGHAMTAQAGAVAAWIPVAMLDPNKRQSFFEASAFQVNPDSVPLYTTPPAAVPVEALEGLVAGLNDSIAHNDESEDWLRGAKTTAAFIRDELTTLIKERSNG